MGADSLDHPGVIPGSPLLGGFLTNLADYVLPDEQENFNFLHCDISGLVGSHVFQRKGNFQSCDTPVGGEGMQAEASKMVTLCYYVSIFYLINFYKSIQNIKNCS